MHIINNVTVSGSRINKFLRGEKLKSYYGRSWPNSQLENNNFFIFVITLTNKSSSRDPFKLCDETHWTGLNQNRIARWTEGEAVFIVSPGSGKISTSKYYAIYIQGAIHFISVWNENIFRDKLLYISQLSEGLIPYIHT